MRNGSRLYVYTSITAMKLLNFKSQDFATKCKLIHWDTRSRVKAGLGIGIL